MRISRRSYSKMPERGLFLSIRDKSDLEEELFCPPHCFPHKLPFTKPIERERCHYHSSRLRMIHHIPYCYLTGCPNYKKMIDEYKKSKNK